MQNFWHLFNGPGSSQNHLSAYSIREQRTLEAFWPPLSLEGWETNNIQKVGLVWDASQRKHLQNLRIVRAVRRFPRKTDITSAAPGFFPQRKLTFIDPSPGTTYAPQPAWILLRNPAIFLSFSLTSFSSPDHRNLAAGINPDVSKATQRTYSVEVLHSLQIISCHIWQIIKARRNSNHRLGTLWFSEHYEKVHLKNLTETLQLKGGESTNDLQAFPRRNVSMSEL